MRTGFELKVVASTHEEAKKVALEQVAKFLEISPEDVLDKVDMELKVSFPKTESVQEIEESMAAGIFQVTAYAAIKKSIAKPFGA